MQSKQNIVADNVEGQAKIIKKKEMQMDSPFKSDKCVDKGEVKCNKNQMNGLWLLAILLNGFSIFESEERKDDDQQQICTICSFGV